MRQKATITGANFAAWGGMFSVVDCSMAYIRQKEDPWNSIASGFITGGLLQIRRNFFQSKTRNLRIFNKKLVLKKFLEGPAAMMGAAVVGGIILAMIEGVSLGISRISGQMALSDQRKYYILNFNTLFH